MPQILEYLVILCFERRYPKQNTVARLKASILSPKIVLSPQTILGWLQHWQRVIHNKFHSICLDASEYDFIEMRLVRDEKGHAW